MSKAQELYWKNRVAKVVQISKAYGFETYSEEFWLRQPAGVVSLIIQMNEDIEHAEATSPTDPNKA